MGLDWDGILGLHGAVKQNKMRFSQDCQLEDWKKLQGESLDYAL